MIRAQKLLYSWHEDILLRFLWRFLRDHGCGIPADQLPKIFDPYFTTKTSGSRLGLAIAYAIVTKHDGYITIASDVRKVSS